LAAYTTRRVTEPSLRRLTIMVGVSYDAASRLLGVGLVLHEADRPGRNGMVVGRVSETHPGASPADADELSILRALEVAVARGTRRLCVRSSNNAVRRRFKEEFRSGSAGDGTSELHSRILQLASTFDEMRFAFQLRRRNDAARSLARAAIHARPASRQARP
jgi:hypothetical protein